MRFFSILSIAMIAVTLAPVSARTQESVVEVNMNALYEAVGAETVAAAPSPTPIARPDSSDLAKTSGDAVRTLQILFGRGDLVISPSGRETLHDWVQTFVSPRDNIEILSYSGHNPESWSEPSLNPGKEITTYSLHEAIRTGFKRALVVRDALIEQGVAEDHIVLRALGPAENGGPAERVDVSLMAPVQ